MGSLWGFLSRNFTLRDALGRLAETLCRVPRRTDKRSVTRVSWAPWPVKTARENGKAKMTQIGSWGRAADRKGDPSRIKVPSRQVGGMRHRRRAQQACGNGQGDDQSSSCVISLEAVVRAQGGGDETARGEDAQVGEEWDCAHSIREGEQPVWGAGERLFRAEGCRVAQD